MRALEELRKTAPRSFDRELIDKIQLGVREVVKEVRIEPAVSPDVSALLDRIRAMAQQIAILEQRQMQMLAQMQADASRIEEHEQFRRRVMDAAEAAARGAH